MADVEGGKEHVTCHRDCNKEGCPQIQRTWAGSEIQIEIRGALDDPEIQIQSQIQGDFFCVGDGKIRVFPRKGFGDPPPPLKNRQNSVGGGSPMGT